MLAAFLGTFLLCAGLNSMSGRLSPAPPSLRSGFALSPDTAVESVGLYSLGMRRAAADLGLIRTLIYYGTGENPDGTPDSGHGHPGHHHAQGKHKELLARARGIIDADPSFTYAVLYVAGALAFNLDRPDEAIDLLKYALSRDPRNVPLRSFAAAVGFHKKGNRGSVIELLEPLLGNPDCPTMTKHLLAYLYRKDGRLSDSRALYQDILDNSRDSGYRAMAAAALRELP